MATSLKSSSRPCILSAVNVVSKAGSNLGNEMVCGPMPRRFLLDVWYDIKDHHFKLPVLHRPKRHRFPHRPTLLQGLCRAVEPPLVVAFQVSFGWIYYMFHDGRFPGKFEKCQFRRFKFSVTFNGHRGVCYPSDLTITCCSVIYCFNGFHNKVGVIFGVFAISKESASFGRWFQGYDFISQLIHCKGLSDDGIVIPPEPQ